VDVIGPLAYVYHLGAAGVTGPAPPSDRLLLTNVLGTQRMLELAQALGATRFVYCGSCSVYGSGSDLGEDAPLRPNSEYAASKASGWMLARAYGERHGLPVVGLRPFLVYGLYEGPRRLVPAVTVGALDGSRISLTEGLQRRDFVHVTDAVNAFLLAAQAEDVVGEMINVCSGVERSVREVASAIVRLAESAAELGFGDIPYRDTDAQVLSGSPEKARRLLGWHAAIELDAGLRSTIDWFRANREVYAAHAGL
jgi:nucleoside-diphosphate-sugar epimerase